MHVTWHDLRSVTWVPGIEETLPHPPAGATVLHSTNVNPVAAAPWVDSFSLFIPLTHGSR